MNDLFDVPPTRPMPADLHERVLAELSVAPDPRRNRAPRWIAPVIAATLVAGVGSGAIALHRSQLVANPMAPVSSSTSGHVLTGQALVSACRSSSSKVAGYDVWAPEGTPGVLFHDRAGDIAVCVAASDGAGTTSARITDPVASRQPFGTSAAVVTSVGDNHTAHAVVAGVMPAGAQDFQLENFESGDRLVLDGRYWMYTRELPSQQVASEPVSRSASWFISDHQHEGTVSWFGTQEDVAITGTRLVEDCTTQWESQHPDMPVTGSLLTPDQHVVQLTVGNGRLAMCMEPSAHEFAESSALAAHPSVSADTMTHMGAGSSASSSYVNGMGGVVPAGVTAIEVSSLDGTTPAAVASGQWAWSEHPRLLTAGAVPVHQLVRMLAGTRVVRSIEVGGWTGPPRTPDGEVSMALRHDDALTTACRRAGSTLLTSWGGHAELVQTASGTATCMVDQHGVRYLVDADRSFPAGLSVGKVASPKTDELPITVYAGGGVAPAGTTDITFRTPMGDVPATVENGRWVFELAVTRRSDSDPVLRATALVTSNGTVTSYPVTLG